MLAKRLALRGAPGGLRAAGLLQAGSSAEGRQPFLPRETKAAPGLPVLGCRCRGTESLIWTSPSPGWCVFRRRGLPDPTPPTPYSRGESLAFEQSKHQLPPTSRRVACLLHGACSCQPGASQLCPPAQRPLTHTQGGEPGPSQRVAPLSPGLMQTQTKPEGPMH